MYGRSSESLGAYLKIFYERLADLPGEKVVKALDIWLDHYEEFPTPAGIRKLVEMDGKPKLSRDVYLSLKAKQRYDRDYADDIYIQRYEAEQRGEAYHPEEKRRNRTSIPDSLDDAITPEEAERRGRLAQKLYAEHGIEPGKESRESAKEAIKRDVATFKEPTTEETMASAKRLAAYHNMRERD